MLTLLAVSTGHAQEASLTERVRVLESRLDGLLRPPSPASADWWRRGSLVLRLGGFVQADAVAYRQDSEDQLDGATGQPLNETRFLIRRARLRTEAESRYVGGALDFDGNTVAGTQARLLGAEVFARWPAPTGDTPYLRASVGLFKIPFGREVQKSDPDRLTLERSQVIRALFPGEYDLGIRLHGGWRFLRYSVAGMNGEPMGESQFAARDPNQSKDLVGRLGVEVAVGPRVRVCAGLSGVYGQGLSPGRQAGKDVLTWRDDNDDGQVQLSELQLIRGQAATPSQNFSRDALGLDVELTASVPRLGELQLSGELIWARNLDRGLVPADPVATGRDLRELGYYASVTQEITPYLRVGLRYDFYDPDADRQEQLGALRIPVSLAFSTLAATVAVQYPGYGRITVEYANQRNPLGRTSAGTVTTLGRDSVILRAQVVF